jgi:hypothetical protein
MYRRNEYVALGEYRRGDSRLSWRTDVTDLDGEDYEWHEDRSKRQVGYISSAFIISYLLVFLTIVAATLAVIVFIKTRHKSGSLLSNQSINLYTGHCDSSLHTYNLIGHFLINSLGTIVLASSNYLQQICSSPDFKTIKKRIEEGKDLKFGSNSPSSVFRQKKSLTFLWISLLLTSLPLHIMINGILGYAVNSIPATSSAIQVTTPGAADTPSYATNWTVVPADQCAPLLIQSMAYVTSFQNITILVNPNPAAPFSFYNDFMQEAGTLTYPYVPTASDISICYINPVNSECQLTVRWFPLLCTAGALLIKATIAFIALHRHEHFRRRIFNSLGDMIAFGSRHRNLRERAARDTDMLNSQPCRELKIRWRQALGRLDLLIAIFWWTSSVGVLSFGLFEWFTAGGSITWSDRFKRFGLGSVDPSTSFVPEGSNYGGNASTFPVQVILANCPQLWLSIGYLLWNNQISRIWMEREWRLFYRHAKKPRVSYPLEGKNPGIRATRWLQLPYWVTFILMGLNTVLHWLVSQTLFVVEILATQTKPAKFYLNFSPFAIVCVGGASTILVLGMTIFYFVPIKTWMPLMAGSLRTVLTSCLHLPPPLPEGGIMWGDISSERERLAGFGEVAADLVPGATYPGNRELEPKHLRNRGSVATFRSYAESERVPFIR